MWSLHKSLYSTNSSFCFCWFVFVCAFLTLKLTVSVGSINGLLFYSNMLKLNKHVLFPNRQKPVLSQFIAWLNLDLRIETCFLMARWLLENMATVCILIITDYWFNNLL